MNHLIDYPTPSNLSYWWSFGSLAGICLVIQIITGVVLAMHYTPHVDLAFLSVEHIMRDVKARGHIRIIPKLIPYPLFQWSTQSKKNLLNLNIRFKNNCSSCTGRSSENMRCNIRGSQEK
jgi:hypothetical protein